MARLSSEIWAILLEFNITPYFDYVESAKNVADIFSRPDLVEIGHSLSARLHWRAVDPPHFVQDLALRIQRTPKEAWTSLWTKLYGGTRHSCG